MHVYLVTITYSLGSGSPGTITIKRKASSPGSAAATVTGIFQALSNVAVVDSSTTPPTSTPYIIISDVAVTDAP